MEIKRGYRSYVRIFLIVPYASTVAQRRRRCGPVLPSVRTTLSILAMTRCFNTCYSSALAAGGAIGVEGLITQDEEK